MIFTPHLLQPPSIVYIPPPTLMNVLQNCSRRLFSLGLITMGFLGAIASPLQALEPSTTHINSYDAPPRTASGAPKRCHHPCVQTYIDFNRDGERDGNELVTSMTVLAPISNVTVTGQDMLEIMVYMPQLDGAVAELEIFKIVSDPTTQNQGGRSVYQEVYFNSAMPLPEDLQQGPRIVTITAPDIHLEPGAVYEWSLSFRCGEADWASPYSTVSGLITHEASDSFIAQPSGTATATPDALLRQAQSYLDRGLWSEALQLTAQARVAKPEAWEQLLASQGLECFKNVPFAGDESANFAIADDPRCFIDQ